LSYLTIHLSYNTFFQKIIIITLMS